MPATPLVELFAAAARPDLSRAASHHDFSRRDVLRAAALVGLAGLAACGEAIAAPRPIRWGREGCDFCHMTFADRRFAAEVWDEAAGRPRVYDDFGCAVLASAERGVVDRADVAFWVVDENEPTSWLDARTAKFRDGAPTPMAYGRAAGRSPDHTLDFAGVTAAIRDKAECEHRG